MKKIMLTDVILPRSSSGVTSCRTVRRTAVETTSAAPVAASAANVSPTFLERPKTIVAAPYAETAQRRTRPCFFGSGTTEL